MKPICLLVALSALGCSNPAATSRSEDLTLANTPLPAPLAYFDKRVPVTLVKYDDPLEGDLIYNIAAPFAQVAADVQRSLGPGWSMHHEGKRVYAAFFADTPAARNGHKSLKILVHPGWITAGRMPLGTQDDPNKAHVFLHWYH